MRGFLVSGKEEFLEPYIAGNSYFDKAVGQLKQTVSDNPSQVQRLTQIEKMKQAWINKAAEPQISMRREIKKGEFAANEFKRISARLVGKNKFDALRGELAQIESAFIKHNDLRGRFILLSILSDMINQETGQRGFLLSGNQASLEPFTQGKVSFKKHVSELKQHLKNVRYPVSSISSALEKAILLAKEWVDLAAQPEIDARNEMNKVTVSLADIVVFIEQGTGKKSMDAIRAEIAKFVKAEQELIKTRAEEAESIAGFTEAVVLICSLIASVLATGAGYYIIMDVQRLVGREPSELADFSRKIADGDLTMHIVKTGRETGIYAAMLDMAASLKQLISNVSVSADSQTNASVRLSSTAEQTLKM